jgi:hypothetical protein
MRHQENAFKSGDTLPIILNLNISLSDQVHDTTYLLVTKDRRLWENISCRGSNPCRLACSLVAILSYCRFVFHLHYSEIRRRNVVCHL